MNDFSDLLRTPEVVKEVEYVYWLKLEPETIENLLKQPQSYTFMDVFLVKTKARFRVKSKDDIVFTKKSKNNDGSNTENNISGTNYEIVKHAMAYSENIHRVKRVEIPITRTGSGEPILSKVTGEQLKWEIDVFYTSKSGGEILPWVKLELEVDDFTSKSLIDIIPIPYLEIIDEADKTIYDDATIKDIWSRLTNVVG